MKQSMCFLVFLIYLFVFLSPASSRFLSTSEVKEEVKHGKVSLPYSLDQMETTAFLNKLMGVEECEEEDGECIKRRIIAEAHLDYIYTQHHDHP
ncbi:hypothetical protein K7X08_003691 [Anisodus acutangulus]|uniref:Phytosulfokine n=1 Tax=Anisodus acutangulus TaxID=402998 RepID=A0A9Q1RGR5_9SOLA|nr:hypothetical protein K7X08_003691 [Anisodus acutangulus]